MDELILWKDGWKIGEDNRKLMDGKQREMTENNHLDRRNKTKNKIFKMDEK